MTTLCVSAEDARANAQMTPRGVVVTYSPGASTPGHGHEASTRCEIARRLAAFSGFAYEGEYDPSRRYPMRPYFVPRDTLTIAVASRIGIRGDSDLFGAVVPYPFVATKTITHPLVDDRSHSPTGWCPEFPSRVTDVVLDGFSAFAKKDALRAGCRLLERGMVRVKPATGVAGLGQYTVEDSTDLVHALDEIEAEEMSRSGVVVDRGRWEVCEHAKIEGRCVVLRPGSYDTLAAMGMNEQISSVRPMGRNAHYEYEAPPPLATPTYFS